MTLNKAILLFLIFSNFQVARSQDSNTITTAVPFASIVANSQSMGMGFVGVVASNINVQNGLDQNPAILSRGKKVMGFQLNYIPWQRDLVPDRNLYELAYYQTLGKNNAFGISAKYLDQGEIYMTDNYGNLIDKIEPWEFMIDIKYAHNFSDHFSMGTGIKYIHSDLTNNITLGDVETHPGQSIAGDLGFDYRRYLYKGPEEKYSLKWNAGLSIINFGSKVNYSGQGEDFIPQNLKLGTLFTSCWYPDSTYTIAWDIAYQVDKLLVPTPPIYGTDSEGNTYIIDGMDPDVSIWKGAVQSFYDAPGGAQEELNEIIHQVGTEARIIFFDNKMLTAIRGGYYHQHETKGDNQIYTMGIGVGYSGFRLDVSYLNNTDDRNPMDNTWGISLSARFNLGTAEFYRFNEH